MHDDLPIVAAGREVHDALDRIRRYCGLPWSGGGPETWAWSYYDAVPTAQDDVVAPTDVVCAAALHPGLSREDLAFFREQQPLLSAWLRELPSGPRLWEVDDDVVAHLVTMPELGAPSMTLLAKVLHRKRPHLVPPLDRHILDWYRPVTGKRAIAEAWGPLVQVMRAEEMDEQRRLTTAIAIVGIERELWPDLPADERPRLSWLRAVDIAIWMGSR